MNDVQEIGLIEEREGRLTAFECKWNPKSKVRFPQTFLGNYPGTETLVITPGNFEEFVS